MFVLINDIILHGTDSCGKPQIESDDILVVVGVGYDKSVPDLWTVLEGTMVNYSCSSGLVHSGPTSSTCMQNGEWEPDPTEVECKLQSANCNNPSSPPNGYVISYCSTQEGERVIFTCQNVSQNQITTLEQQLYFTSICNAHGNWEPDPSEFCSSK